MANRNSAGFGLIPTSTLGSTPSTQGQGNYYIDAGDTTAIYHGSPVKTAAGYVVEGTSATTGTQIGALNGVFYNAATTETPTWANYYAGSITPANSEDITAFVTDNPWQQYTVATDDTVAQAGFLETYGLNASAGSTTTGQSSQTLDIGSTNATTYQWRLLRIADDPENKDITAAYASVIVVANLNEFKDSA